jgi:hypothetical protein
MTRASREGRFTPLPGLRAIRWEKVEKNSPKSRERRPKTKGQGPGTKDLRETAPLYPFREHALKIAV